MPRQNPRHLSVLSVAFAPILLLSTAAPAPVQAADWPQWRGPARDGRSGETGLLQAWSEGGPPLAFKASGLGGGFSSVSVAGDRIFTMGDLQDGQYAMALSREDGSRLWKTQVGPTWEDKYLGPRSTPTTDGDRVYLVSTEGEVYCLNAADGTVRWSRSLPEEFGGAMMEIRGYHWKFTESPLVDGDRVIVTPGANDAVMVALNKMTGEEIWRAKLPELGENGADGAGYSSVIVSNGGGVRHYVQLVGRGAIGVETETGRFLWGYNRVANNVANIPTPIVDGDYVFTSSGYGQGSALLKLSADGEGGVKAEEVYFLSGDTMQNHHGGLILHDGHVFTGTGHNKGFPLAVRMDSGEIAWGPVRNDGKDSAAISYADGRIYFRYQNGLMVLVEATPQEYREHGSFMIPEVRYPSWPHPVIAGGRLYLREQDNLFVYDVTAR